MERRDRAVQLLRMTTGHIIGRHIRVVRQSAITKDSRMPRKRY